MSTVSICRDSHLYFNNLMIDFYSQPRRNNRNLSSLAINNKKHHKEQQILTLNNSSATLWSSRERKQSSKDYNSGNLRVGNPHRIQWFCWDEQTQVRVQGGQGGWTLHKRILAIHLKCLKGQWYNFLFSDYGHRGKILSVILFCETQIAHYIKYVDIVLGTYPHFD